jgi:hypothetical protein
MKFVDMSDRKVSAIGVGLAAWNDKTGRRSNRTSDLSRSNPACPKKSADRVCNARNRNDC